LQALPQNRLFLHRFGGVTHTEGAGLTQTEGGGVTHTVFEVLKGA